MVKLVAYTIGFLHSFLLRLHCTVRVLLSLVVTVQPLEEISTQNGILNLIQIPCHHVLANEIDLNLKYRIGLKHFFNINLGIAIIKKTTFFVCIFDISPRVFPQILIRRARWMRN